jgi:hypothetical protein
MDKTSSPLYAGSKGVCVTWDDFIAASKQLAAHISQDYQPTKLVALTRGGWVPALVLSQLFDIADLSCISVRYEDARRTQPIVAGPLPVTTAGDRVLLVEDFLLSGESLRLAERSIQRTGVQVKTAALGFLPGTAVVPDYSLGPQDSSPRFPWERAVLSE